jgi:predicted nucleic-acid-binding Zn-ribbon protein
MMTNAKPCPECGQKNLYLATTNAGGGHGPILLPGVNGIFTFAKFQVVVCADCGLTRFFADDQARAKVPTCNKWSRI